MKKVLFILLFVGTIVPLYSSSLFYDLAVTDYPGDDGSALKINYAVRVDKDEEDTISFNVDSVLLYRQNPDGSVITAATFNNLEGEFVDKNGIKNGNEYTYKLVAVVNGIPQDPSQPYKCKAEAQWFDPHKTNVMLAVLIYTLLLVYLVQMAKQGKSLYIRRIAGLDELDEAVGRATEMGKPVLYVPGLSSMSDVATIAAINILGPVAKKVAEYDTRILVPNRDPIVMTVAQEVVKEAFVEAGRPDAYRQDDVFFLTDSQFGFAAAVNGIMIREKPATNLFLGMFWAESLILAETGNMAGAIQIAGTDAVTQLPFFVASCDYTIMGEELYAASAYLSREPLLVGSLKVQDYSKVIILAVLLVSLGVAAIGWIIDMFNGGSGIPSWVITTIDFFRSIFNA